MFTSIILALHSLLQLTVLSSVSILPGFMQTKLFTPTGDYLTTLILIILGIGSAIPKLNSDNLKSKSLSLITILLGTISSVAIISLMLPGSILSLTLIPYKETWSITLDALKSLRSLFLGVGIANYSSHFTAVKPLSLNATSLWNTLPQTGTSELLTLFTTTGILGGFALILIFIQSLRESKNTALYFPIIIATIALIFTPASIPLYVIYFVMIASLSHSEPTKLDLTPKTAIVIGIFGISLLITGYAYSLRPIIAEFYISKAQAALKNSDGKGVYDNSLKAIQFYPRMTIYHMSFADTNMSLATALSQKQGLSDEEKTTISTLIQQAVSEGKNAVTLRPNYSSAWLTLAKIYRNLINVASGADTYAIENYARAVALDPANPSLRIEFGGIFYQLGVSAKEQKDKDIYFGRAKSEFQTAIQLRANLPNAYYNLSKLYETTNDYEGAYLAMQKTLSLLGPDNPDLDRATAELATLKTKLPKPTTAPTTPPSTSTESSLAPSDLATPSPLPSPLPSGSLDVDFK
jgi:tetratricopeptide (TPR) repeat protein